MALVLNDEHDDYDQERIRSGESLVERPLVQDDNEEEPRRDRS